jgi:hypothetical protein
VLPRAANGGFGRIEANFEVRFGAKAVAALLSVKQISAATELAIRSAMRQIILSNYLKSDELHDVAFACATAGVFKMFREEGFATFMNASERVFEISIDNAAIAAPKTVVLDRMERGQLATLYSIEDSMVGAIKGLYKVLGSGTRMDPEAFEKKLGDFGDALNSFDKFDQTTNTRGIGVSSIFVMFDALIRIASKGENANIAVLRLASDAGGHPVEKLFMTSEVLDDKFVSGASARERASAPQEKSRRQSTRRDQRA